MEGVAGIPKTTIYRILTKYLMKKKVAAQWVSHTLFPAQKHHMELCQKYLTLYEKEGIDLLQQIITIDETQVHSFKPKLKSQSKGLREKIHRGCKNSDTKLRRWNNDDNGLILYRCIGHICGAIYSYSTPACVCTLSVQNFEA